MIRSAVAASLLLALAAGAVQAQEKEAVLQLGESKGSFCIWYLVDPALAPALAPAGVSFTTAGTMPGLTPFLARVIQDEPQFAAWIPAAICLGRYGTATLDGRQVARAKGDGALLIMTRWIAAKDPLDVSGTAGMLVELATDHGGIGRPLNEFGVGVDDRSLTILPGNEGGDSETTFKVGKTRISWVGHPTGDPRVASTRTMSFGYAGMRKSAWRITEEVAPGESRLMVGALRVEGKDDLAKALKASPIRAVGPFEQGGTATLTLHRVVGR